MQYMLQGWDMHLPPPTTPDPRLYGTSGKPDSMEKAKALVKDELHEE